MRNLVLLDDDFLLQDLHGVQLEQKVHRLREAVSRRGSNQYLLFTQQPGVKFSAFPRTFLLVLPRLIDGTALNSGQRLDDVN